MLPEELLEAGDRLEIRGPFHRLDGDVLDLLVGRFELFRQNGDPFALFLGGLFQGIDAGLEYVAFALALLLQKLFPGLRLQEQTFRGLLDGLGYGRFQLLGELDGPFPEIVQLRFLFGNCGLARLQLILQLFLLVLEFLLQLGLFVGKPVGGELLLPLEGVLELLLLPGLSLFLRRIPLLDGGVMILLLFFPGGAGGFDLLPQDSFLVSISAVNSWRF